MKKKLTEKEIDKKCYRDAATVFSWAIVVLIVAALFWSDRIAAIGLILLFASFVGAMEYWARTNQIFFEKVKK